MVPDSFIPGMLSDHWVREEIHGVMVKVNVPISK